MRLSVFDSFCSFVGNESSVDVRRSATFVFVFLPNAAMPSMMDGKQLKFPAFASKSTLLAWQWLCAPPSWSPPNHHHRGSANHFSYNRPNNKLFRKPWNLTLLQIPPCCYHFKVPFPHLYSFCCCFSASLQCNQITSLKSSHPPFPSVPLKNFGFCSVLKFEERCFTLTVMCLLRSPPQSWLNVHLVCRLGPH